MWLVWSVADHQLQRMNSSRPLNRREMSRDYLLLLSRVEIYIHHSKEVEKRHLIAVVMRSRVWIGDTYDHSLYAWLSKYRE